MAAQGLKDISVVDDTDAVVGVITENDFLRRLGADSFLHLMPRLLEDPGGFSHSRHETPVRAVMSAPAVCVPREADYQSITGAFHQCRGSVLPVVDRGRRICGPLLRKDFTALGPQDTAP